MAIPLPAALHVQGPPWVGPPRGTGPGPAAAPPTAPQTFPRLFPPRAAIAHAPNVQAIDPNASYTTEPAPLGVTDFGVDRGGNAYAYNTTSFVGTADMGTLRASGCTGSSYCTVVGLQLNVELLLEDPATATSYTYWVQNVIQIDTGSQYVAAVNNIWNFTGPATSNSLNRASVQGNGSIQTYGSENVYIDSMNCSAKDAYPGGCTYFSWPLVLQDRVASFVRNGEPGVGFDFASGTDGWVRWDTAYFPFATGFVDRGFYVTGYAYNSHDLYDDAEFVLTGAKPGWVDSGSHANLSLQFWNGHNLQAVPNAFNHGGNTAESISNLIASANRVAPQGIPGTQLAPGRGSVGYSYTDALVGTLTVDTPLASGAITVNGTGFSFRDNSSSLTLFAGTYTVVLDSTLEPNQGQATVTAGGVTVLRLGFGYVEPVVFNETGLPAGTFWAVTVDNQLLTSQSNLIETGLVNATYGVRFSAVTGFSVGFTGSSIVVSGPTNVSVPYRAFTFGVSFEAQNLPADTYWWVNVSGTTVGGNQTVLEVPVANGTHDYAVGTSYEFIPAPAFGTVDVLGRVAGVTIAFSVREGFITGRVSPLSAAVTIDGGEVPVDAGSFNVTVLPGAHQIVTTAQGYVTNSTLVLVTPGNATYSVFAMATQASTGPPPPGPSGSSTGWEWVALGAVVAVAVAVGAGVVLWGRRPRTG